MAGSRLLVQREIYDLFIEKICSLAEGIRLGDPMDPETQMGPLANAPHFKKVISLIDQAVSDGLRVAYGGKSYSHPHGGFFRTTNCVPRRAQQFPTRTG